jgi:hypothetical protein
MPASAVAPVLLAHAEVTKNIIYILMGTKLKYSAVLHLFGHFPRVSEGIRSPRACVHTHAYHMTRAIAHKSTLHRLKQAHVVHACDSATSFRACFQFQKLFVGVQ